MPFSIEVTDYKSQSSFGESLSEESFKEVASYCNGRAVISLLPATLIPVRTNTPSNFCKDFFAPTLFNHAMVVHHSVQKFFMILGALILDFLTFPIRLFLSIPRVIQNETGGEQMLRTYLKQQGTPLASDYVRVKLKWEEGGMEFCLEKIVNFIDLPIYRGCKHSKRFQCPKNRLRTLS